MNARYLDTVASIRAALDAPDDDSIELVAETLADWSPYGDSKDVERWFLAERERLDREVTVETIPLDECRGWEREATTGNIVSESGSFFVVEGVRTVATTREVRAWDQPIIRQIGFDGGILGLLRQRHDSVPHYLVEAKAEPGNVGLALVSPTLQATFANIERHHGGRAPYFVEWFLEPIPRSAVVLRKAWFPEDGGRLMKKRNLGMIVEVVAHHHITVPPGFRWVSLYQLRQLIRESSYVGPHIRSLVSLL